MANKSASFIENVNTLANAQSLATGDVVEDTKIAKDEAVASAAAALTSEINSQAYESRAQNWAEKGHNNPVTGTAGIDAEYSAYHWKTEAELLIGDPVIDDLLVSNGKTYSSQKVFELLAGKSAIDHNHDNTYELKFNKNTAFNKSFGTSLGTVAQGYHTHDGLNGSVAYEPEIGVKGTGFNKNLGTTAGTVAEGNHTHDYEPTFTKNTAFNKNFVVDPINPTADEIPRGNHIHPASGISYDNTSSSIITSTTVQGALSQVDSTLDTIIVEEKCKLVAGITDISYTVPVTTANTPVIFNGGMTVLAGSKNAIYSNGVTVNYPTAPSNLIEGNYTATVCIEVLASKSYYITPTINGTVIDSSFKSEIGDTTKTVNGALSVTISGWISGLSNGDVIGLALVNATDTTDILVYGATVSFAGQPEGALIVNGLVVTHSDVLGRDVADQHTISAITGLQTALDSKSATTHTHVIADITDFDPATKQDLVVPLSVGNIATLDGLGNITDGGAALASKAEVGGSGTQVFKVGTGIANDDAVNKSQVEGLIGSYTLQTSFDSHEALSNPHGTTASDVGAAEAIHVHAISDTTGLQTALDSKYSKPVAPVTGNLPSFDAGNILIDSGVVAADIVEAPLGVLPALDGSNLTNVGVGDHTLLSNIGTNTHDQIDTNITATTSHMADTSMHFTQASISITESQISDLGSYEAADADIVKAPLGVLPVLDGSNLTGVSTVSTVSDLTDTTITTPTDGQVLSYDNATSKWINSTAPSGVTDHTLLTNIGTLTHAQIDSAIIGTLLTGEAV